MESVTIIKPIGRVAPIEFGELWEYRELFYFLVWRDIKVRYKQTILGAGWAVVRPIVSMVVFTFIFNKLAGFSAEGVPYPLFTFVGVLAWGFFSEGLTAASQSLIGSSNLLSKVYFPRLIIPSSAVLRGLADFGIAVIIFLGLATYYRHLPGWHILVFPLAVAWCLIATLGVGLWFSALSVKYRDIAQALPFVTQLLFWITPIGYSSSRIPSRLDLLYWINPMTGVTESFRYALLGSAHLPQGLLLYSVMTTCLIFLLGLRMFKRMEKDFADLI